MTEAYPWEITRGDNAQRAVRAWAESTTREQWTDRNYQQAFEAIDRALVATISYMRDREKGAKEDYGKENELTHLWLEASHVVSLVDPEVADACMMKGMGWTDPSSWETARQQGLKIGIGDMQEARQMLNRSRYDAASRGSVPRWFPVAGVIFAAITLLFLMYLLIGPPIAAGKQIVFNVFMALSVAASASFLGGSAAASGKIPFVKNSPIEFSAGGGIAVFVIVFLVLKYANP